MNGRVRTLPPVTETAGSRRPRSGRRWARSRCSAPQLRGTDEAFCSQLFGTGVTRTNAFEAPVIAGWVRGLSDRDVEAALAEALGPEAALSRSTVSRICQKIRTEFEAWRTRSLEDVHLDYLFLERPALQDAPGCPGRAGARRLWDRHVQQAGVRGPWADGGRVHRRLGRVPGRPGRPGASGSAAGDLRRGAGAHLGRRAPLLPEPSPTMPDPSPAKRPCQGLGDRPGRVQGGVVGRVRRHRRGSRGGGGGRGRTSGRRLRGEWERRYRTARSESRRVPWIGRGMPRSRQRAPGLAMSSTTTTPN